MSDEHQPFLIVGIGASAGGLAVLKMLVRSLMTEMNMAFIIIQHLDPTHESILSELLARESILPIQDAQDGLKVKPDNIYVIPPNYYLEVENGKIRLTEPEQSRSFRRAIDHCFHSLAQECGQRCAGIILSGSGSDGTAGLRAIKAAGGLTLAQKPETAEYESMPLSAINADVVDKILPVEDMPGILKQYADHPLTIETESNSQDTSAVESLEEITAILKTHEHFDLRQYKPTTVLRRIARRMSLTNIGKYQEYLIKLRENGKERRQLTKDLLINVTYFFRDLGAFEFLEQKVIPDILANLGKDEEIRVWVPGCASGEEAYSIAILFLAGLSHTSKKNHIKIFATDIDPHAIKIARKGLYSESIIGEMPAHYLEKYFIKLENDHHYQINSQVRDIISFAVQNVTVDPPFSNMHLISCRNLLIYLRKEIQERVIGSFYFSLKSTSSYLLLGSSETIGTRHDLFKVISKKWRIYKKLTTNKERSLLEHLHIEKSDNDKTGGADSERRKIREPLSRADQMRRCLLDTFLPPGVIVDQEGKIIYNHGDWKTYMAIPTGEPRHEIGQWIVPTMRSRLLSAFYKVRKNKVALSFHCNLPTDKQSKTKIGVRVEISPLVDQQFSDGEAFGIIFYEQKPSLTEQDDTLSKEDEIRAYQDLQQELADTKEELQNTIEELETSTEELKASHEEALSTNEELQSANEELEASSEELRSLNEELSTINEQLKDKIEQLQKATNDVENFFASADVPIVFLDADLKIQRYTPSAERLLKMGPWDLDRPIHALRRDLVDEQLVQECRWVLDSFQPIRKEFQGGDGHWYIRQITPYRTEERRIEGVVIVFQNINEAKALSLRAESREQQQAVVAKLGMLALSGIQPEELMQQAVRQIAHTLNADYCKILKYQPQDHRFLLVAGVGWQEHLIGQAIIQGGQDSQAGYTLSSREPVIVKNLAQERRFKGSSLLVDHQVISGISCVINHSQPSYGVLGVHTKQYREFTHDDANFLVSVAHMLSTALRTRDAQEKLYESEEQFRTLANSIPQLTWMADASGLIYWFNQRWYDYTGTSLEQVRGWGWGWQNLLHPDHVNRVVKAIKHSFAQGTEWEDTFPLRNKEGEYRWFLSRAKPIRNPEGKTIRWFGTNTDTTEQLEQEQALRASEQKLRIAKDSGNLGIFDYDIPHNTIEWDVTIRNIWGVGIDKPVTMETFFEGLHPEDVKRTEKAIARSIDPKKDGVFQVTYRVINKNSHQIFWIKASGQVTFQNNNPIRMVGMVLDITKQKELEESLQQVVIELQEIDHKKNEFLSILGHELRNPLAAISSNIELLNLIAAPKTQDSIKIMKRSVGIMARLLDDLLDLNRISQNRIHLDLRPINIKDILANALSATQKICTDKNHAIETDIDSPLWVNGDSVRLEQIFCNLIINACKYTPAGGKLQVQAHRRGSTIQVQIQDNGIGIDSQIQDRIFEPFFQGPQIGKMISGLGIGLSLSKKLAELHDGHITVASVGEGQGSIFTVELPAQDTPATTATKTADDTKRKIRPGFKVVLIEDNADILATLPILLKALGCEVKMAENAKDGLRLVEEFNPDALLIDIGLPDMTGHDLAAKLRANGHTKLMVALSGYSHTESREKSKEAGFDFHLAKPATLDVLATILASVN